MFAIIGIVIVFGAVLGGYLMEHGNVRVLIQPAELLIIAGAAVGTILIANPLHILKQIAAGIVEVFKGSNFTKQRYLDSLKLSYDLLNKARRQGLMSLETDVEDPDKSPIFSKDPAFLKSAHVRHFFCDSMRMAISGLEAFELDQLMEMDLDVHHHGGHRAGFILDIGGRFSPRSGNCGGGIGSGNHYERAGWTSGRNWTQSGGGACRHISRNSALLRARGASGGKYVKGGGSRARLFERAARADHFFSQGNRSHLGG